MFSQKRSILVLLTYFLIPPIHSLVIVFAADDLRSDSEEKLMPSRAQFKKWYEKAHVSLMDSKGRLIDLNLEKYNDEPGVVPLSVTQQSALRDVIRRNAQSFCASSFGEYLEANKAMAGGELKISPIGYQRMHYNVKHDDAIKRPELLTDYELVEAYWTLSSKVGFLKTHFVALVPDESYYRLREIRDGGELMTDPDPFPKDRKTCGYVLQDSSYIWGDADPATEFKSHGNLLVADIRYMIKTNVPNLAYPICIRVYWCERLERWIPWFCIEYNAPERRCKVVF